MPILNYTTKISPSKTIGEIQEILVNHGASSIACEYDSVTKRPVSVRFGLLINNSNVFFELPANYEGVLKAMKADQTIKSTFCNIDQAVKVAWRILKDWIEAQCAIIEAGLAEMSEVFLPYAVTQNGSTLYKEIKANTNLLLKS
ncbi:hypothetical protein [Dyadobacter chenhuakuii]|uniref:Uncharacterized protein n=1 Tax=Dyadobacter chenhuakuii TaxID=2909339 RepID=A0A9X1QAQ0_9BACT|nr:hypothetical protein [Dyadobacter chenhuakuii]MCF2498373.1 hypothetical protein [Dyadobacter chenhuakuii]